MTSSFKELYNSKDYRDVLKNKPSLFPFIIDVELTNHCNFNCVFCGQREMKREKGFMSTKMFKEIVEECRLWKVPIRLIRWGEPLLHPNIVEYCQHIKDNNLPLHITTNGSMLTDEMIEAFVEMGVDSIIFSMQGATKKGYEQMRGNHYELLEENIEKLFVARGRKKKPYIQITSTMTNETKEEIKAFIDYWEKTVDEVSIGKTNLSRVKVSPELKKQETIKKEYRPCTEVYQKLSVDWDGKVSCCCADWDRFMTVGDLSENTLQEIWGSSKRLKAFRKILDAMGHKKLEMCKKCYHTYKDF